MCDRAHPRALPAVPGDGSHPSWAFPSRVHEGSGYPASHRRTAYKVTPWPSHERPHKTPASSTCARTTKPSVPQHRGALLTPPAPYKGEGNRTWILLISPHPAQAAFIFSFVIPAKAGIQGLQERAGCPWTPAFAGVTEEKGLNNPCAIALPLLGVRRKSS